MIYWNLSFGSNTGFRAGHIFRSFKLLVAQSKLPSESNRGFPATARHPNSQGKQLNSLNAQTRMRPQNQS
jgi:hypothetical protein